ncbi:MAG TPA: hypothetical protein VGJ27_06210 [Gaiellaceae bacterium]
MALPITLGVTCVFAITGTTVLVYSSGSSRQAYYSTSRQGAGALSEAGLNNALAVVFKPGNNPLNPYLFCSPGETLPCPPRSATVDGHTIAWTGTLDQSQTPAVWALKGTAKVRNPTGPGRGGLEDDDRAGPRHGRLHAGALEPGLELRLRLTAPAIRAGATTPRETTR